MAILERINPFKEQENVSIESLLNSDCILFLDPTGRNDAIEELVNSLKGANKIQESEPFLQAILKREEIVSTGIGMGIALPHAKLDEFNEFFIAVGIVKDSQGIQWEALDGQCVQLIFMIGGPPERQNDYLKILSYLTENIRQEELRKKLLECNNASQVMALFKEC